MQEEWKDVVINDGKYIGRYQVSNLGQVRSHPDCKIPGCTPGNVLFQSEDNKGYKQVYLYYKYKQHTVKVHRLVMTSFIGEPNGLTVNHIDGDKSNNRLSNLEYITNKENCRHAYRTIDSRSGIIVHGQKMSIAEAVDKFGAEGVTAKSARRRIFRLGWDVMDALSIPIQKTGRPKKGREYVRK